jgi:predicted ATPase/DNA-binding winged helix-turn-helix (wHTH) protein
MPTAASPVTRDFSFGRCVIRSAERQLLLDGQPVKLGARAFDVLMALLERRDSVVSKNELLDTVWPGLIVEENNLQVQISTLRKLLGPQTIVTIPGRGYRFLLTQSVEASNDATLPSQRAAPAAAPTAAPTTPVATPEQARAAGNVPTELLPLLGRGVEVAALQHATQLHRLITITGAGGMGKTRLAQTVARSVARNSEDFPDGVWFVELAPVSDRLLVMGTVARVLGIPLPADATDHDLALRLTDRSMMIVIDNCEHLIEAVASLANTLLRVAPAIRLLATSQESLKLPQEHVFRLGALGLPAAAATVAVTDGALALFEVRAQAVMPAFSINDGNRATVVEICRRLDGIPLAIEFAAARLPLLGADGLLRRLDDRFRLLTGGNRLAPKRQQTLHATLEWSHSLLTPPEQKAFWRFGVFAGSFNLTAAEAVGTESGEDPWAVLDHLGALVDKSLVISESGERPRYRLLESARVFALEHLRSSNEIAAVTRRHAEAVLHQFESAHAQRWIASTDALLADTLPDIDNLRAALTWAASESGDNELLAALAGATGWFWQPANLTAEGVNWFATAVARLTDDVTPDIEARLLLGYAVFSYQATAEKEFAALQRAATLYRNLNDEQGLYETLVTLAQKQVWRHDIDGAQASIDEASALFDRTWLPTMREGLLTARTYLLEVTGRPADGQPVMEELVALMRRSGDDRKLDHALMQLAENLFIQGKAAEAIAVRREVAARVGDRRVNYAASNLGNLCAALVFEGELDAALDTARVALPLIQHEGALVAYQEHFALLACKLGRHAEAAKLLGRSNANVAASGFERQESELRAARMAAEALGTALGADELERCMKEGVAMSDEAAVRMALGIDRRVGPRA